jgi:hypothetical protein
LVHDNGTIGSQARGSGVAPSRDRLCG